MVMIKAGIIGSTGYAGNELVRLLKGHKDTELIWLGSRSYTGRPFASVYPNFRDIVKENCSGDELAELAEEADVIFTATPQGFLSSLLTDSILEKTKIIDLSADFRFKDAARYAAWYGQEHPAPHLLPQAVYGLCEVNREKIKATRLLGNPGCYPTCSTLSLYPLVKEGLIDPATIIIDAKSGTSGAGRSAKTDNLFCEVNENIKAYGVTTHRHTPEIEDQLGYACGKEVVLNFTPHLIPMNRGILVTAYASLTKEMSWESVKEVYDSYYGEEFFIRVLPQEELPQTRWVEGSNFVDINFRVDKRTGRIVVMGAIDNLVKGAAGQAVQNMNLMFGLPETEGLEQTPMFP